MDTSFTTLVTKSHEPSSRDLLFGYWDPLFMCFVLAYLETLGLKIAQKPYYGLWAQQPQYLSLRAPGKGSRDARNPKA